MKKEKKELIKKFKVVIEDLLDNYEKYTDEEKAQIKDMGAWTITSNSVKGNGGMMETYSMPGVNLSVQVPVEESVIEAQKQISHIMYPVEEPIEE